MSLDAPSCPPSHDENKMSLGVAFDPVSINLREKVRNQFVFVGFLVSGEIG